MTALPSARRAAGAQGAAWASPRLKGDAAWRGERSDIGENDRERNGRRRELDAG
jgi:hypothetical protein